MISNDELLKIENGIKLVERIKHHLRIRFSDQTEDHQNWYLQLLCWTFNNDRKSVKPPVCEVDRWAGWPVGRLTGGQVAAWLKNQKIFSVFPRHCNLVNDDVKLQKNMFNNNTLFE